MPVRGRAWHAVQGGLYEETPYGVTTNVQNKANLRMVQMGIK